MPGGDSKHPSVVPIFSVAPAMANQKSHGNYPAVIHIMSCVFEGCLVDIDTGLEIESRYFAACVLSTESKNMINTLWTQLNSIKKVSLVLRVSHVQKPKKWVFWEQA